MTTPDDNHEDLLHQQEEADRKHRESMEGSGVVLLAGLIPFTLVMIVLSAIFGDWVYNLTPVLLIALYLGFKLWHFYRHRMESDLPLVVPRPDGTSRIFTGKQKRNLTRGGVLLVFVSGLVVFFGQVPLTKAFYAARDALLSWTVPWGW